MDIADRTIIITGGNQGIGLQLVNHFLNKGSKIAVLDLALDNLIQTEKEFKDKLFLYECDVTDEEKVKTTLDKCFETTKEFSVLINNAGIMYSSPLVSLFGKHSMDDWRKVIDINLTSVFHITSEVVHKMMTTRTQGLIINISSICAKGNVGQSAYSASKAALESLAACWSKELAPLGIRAAAIAPGFIETEGGKNALSEKQLESWKNKVPLKRLGTKQEIVMAVNMIIENDYFNGKVLQLDGGLTI